MKGPRKLYCGVISWFVCLSTSLAFAAETSIRSYSLPDHGSVQLQVPINWADQIRQPPRRLPPTLSFRQKTGAPFEVLMTPLWAIDNNALPDGHKLQQIVTQSAEEARTQSVEKTIDIIELRGSSGTGFYFSATDRAPKPGEYKYLTQGIIRIGDLMVTFTILTNDNQADVVTNALIMLKTASHKKDLTSG